METSPSVTPVTGTAAAATTTVEDAPSARAGRRRQRSVRVTTAVALLAVATVLVVAGLVAGSALWLGVVAVLAVASGWAAARIVHAELAQSRREAAADRAQLAQEYRTLFAASAEEHAAFSTAMGERLARNEGARVELEATVVTVRARLTQAETRVQREARRANDAQEQVVALTEEVGALTEQVDELTMRLAEQDDELATWQDDTQPFVVPDEVDLRVAAAAR